MTIFKVLQRLVPGKFFYKELETGELINIEGDDYELLKILSEYMGFQYEIRAQPKNMPLGMKGTDGNWTDVCGMFQRGEVDMNIGVPNDWQSSEVVSYSYPYDMGEVTFGILKAGFASKNFFYVNPFQKTVWILIALAICFCTIFLWTIRHYTEKRRALSLFDELFYSVEVFARNFGIDRRNLYTKLSTKLFLGFVCLALTIIRFCYTSIYPAFLMAPIMEPQISTFDQLSEAYDAGRINVTTFKGSALYRTLLRTENHFLKKVVTDMQTHPEIMARTPAELKNAVESGLAIILARNVLQNLFADKENVFISSDYAWIRQVCIGFKKDFCCKPKFDSTIRRLQEAGIYQKIVRHSTFRKSIKARDTAHHREEIIRQIRISDLIGILWLLAFSYAVCIIVFLFEYFLPKIRDKIIINRP